MKTTQNGKARVMRAARGRLGLTQLDLARKVGCSESQITKIETGRAVPEQSLKEAIARELGIETWEVGQ
ncbi:MAG TPA: helix-turn-helix transcriptional regulator [Candidatus Paceibacterota bacterium]|nr:helix-turn-helix transcriptional regulator [Candidatus Paceibacterota bacterium]HRZ57212.1 helix-turn-helix transcriptional regulator [Candidatus Paceibacterota bacterium]